MEQNPHPGRHVLAFCGDTLEFTLRVPGGGKGRAWLRTNVGHADTARTAIVAETTLRQKRLAEDWFDVPMAPAGGDAFRIVLPLTEPGHFEAKAFFLPEGAKAPLWPQGDNTAINVHPAEYACGNSLYNAFVRLFGQETSQKEEADPVREKCCKHLDELGYAIIPRSGTFRDLIRQLDFIVGKLNCRILMLLPIHPTPTVYGRMGEFGSPYAALDFMEVDPALAEFDTKAMPMDQFCELVDAVHARGAKIFLDIAINHTGWAARIHSTHPEWLVRNPDGSIRSPGAWGTTWADLAELDHNRPELWRYLAEVFLTWCRRGVDGFRCDAGYMIPVPAWEFIVASVRREFPDTLFLLEGLGGGIDATTSLLNISNLNWAYSELFQNYDRGQIESYLDFAFRASGSEGLLVHFAETHDNPRLAARSQTYARMRTALSALCSVNGAFAFANGVEWFAAGKIDVHKRTSLSWNNPVNQVDFISRLNHILATHPAFFSGARLKLIQRGRGNSIVLLRHHPPSGKKLLVLVNLDDKSAQDAAWSGGDAQLSSARLIDLLTGREMKVAEGDNSISLAPGEALCLTPEPADMRLVAPDRMRGMHCCEQLRRQRLRAKALEALTAIGRIGDVSGTDPDKMADELARDPRGFCGKLMHRKFQEVGPHSLCGRKDGGTSCPALPTEKLSCSAGSNLQPDDNVVIWNWPVDSRREVMIPPNHFLLVTAASPFRARLCEGINVLAQQDAVRAEDGSHFALFMPRPAPSGFLACALDMAVFPSPSGSALHAKGPVLFLPEPGLIRVRRRFGRNEVLANELLFLGTNGRGGMMRAAAKWGEVRSKYDALLAGNLSTDHPEDRRVMFTRCRAWLVYQSYSQDVTIDRLESFAVDDTHAHWHFRVPFGYGKMVFVEAEAAMLPGLNAVRLSFKRMPAMPRRHCLADGESVTLIIRPDLEDRSFHEETKAFLGPENAFRQAVQPRAGGFVFAPAAERRLKVDVSRGEFHHDPEWQYMVHHPVEAGRGLPAHCDLFSPGYFRCELKGGDEVALSAVIETPQESAGEILPVHLRPTAKTPEEEEISAVLLNAMKQFIVRRGSLKTVIAGYPWFLDWGRDTLIFCRGMAAAGMKEEVLSILRQFAAFEEGGTLPNMILGDNASNRDSSDAPLWLFTACADLTRSLGDAAWLGERIVRPGAAGGGRTMLETLVAMAQSLRKGTYNGIACDPESGLIFSPAHFTWMDTSHPAGTPREGYPVEIQALWFAALKFLAEVTGDRQWAGLAHLVQESVMKLFWNEKENFFADCLHAAHGRPAAKATAGDALRPNQLLALTMGLVTDEKMSAGALSACSGLLVPGAIRTLADRPVRYPLPVEHGGRLLNDPGNPYWGRYEGDEDTRRKPAYHNGTAWTWIFPSFCEAWFKHYGAAGRPAALAILNSSLRIINRGCLGQIPEILDGDFPHFPRGCDAQAWGVSELYRVWKVICPD